MKYNLLLLFMTMGGMAMSQSVTPMLLATGTGGGNFNNSYILWSLGEGSISTLGSTPYQVTQGFWQPEMATITGVNGPLQSEYSIACWPNPVTDALQIAFNLDKTVLVSLYSLDGRLLLPETTITSGRVLSLGQWPAALYLLRFTTENGKWILTQKIVKQ